MRVSVNLFRLCGIACMLFFSSFYAFQVNGQSAKSIHQEESEYYKSLGYDEAYYAATNQPATRTRSARDCAVNKVVYGWHPYWMNGLQVNYDWNLLSHFVYFSYEVNASNGNAVNTYNFAGAQSVTDALNNGVKVHLCVTLFSNHATFFSNPTARQTLITNLINMVQSRGAHGVNIDFENMSSSLSADFTNFMIDLCNQMHAQIPGSEVTVALHAVDWSGFYNLPALQQVVDMFIIMGYDYYWSGSNPAGPNDPLFHFGSTYNYTLSRSTTYYHHNGVPLDKLVLGLPYYGRDWPVSSHTLPSPTTGTGSSRTYKVVKDNTSGFFSQANRNFEPNSRSVYYNYNNGGLRQCFISEENELRERMDFANKRGLAGMGIWALGYDDGYNELWDAIADHFSDCATQSCSGSIYDIGGGPNRNYYGNENYTFTLAPQHAQQIDVAFTYFSTESGFDFLYIYDGPSEAYPQIPGSPFSGTTTPGSFSSSSGQLTFRFVSDNSAESSGWFANYSCITDNVPPLTVIETPVDWITDQTELFFTDSDNEGGSGVAEQFWLVAQQENGEWRAKADQGFFIDSFESEEIHTDWTVQTGNWEQQNGVIRQTNEVLGNTSVTAFVNQLETDKIGYSWSGKLSGSGTNRRAGLHFLSVDPTLTNHGNSYFAWFRLDNQKIQFYKVVNDDFGSPVVDITYPFQADTWYEFAVFMDKNSGQVRIYINNQLLVSWTDANPQINGQYIGLRSGNCIYEVDNLHVYKLRGDSELITVGEDNNHSISVQNQSPSAPAGKIISLILDQAGNVSTPATQLVNVDWSAPELLFVHDGLTDDVDLFNSTTISANWDGLDPHSGISSYSYAIGEAPNGTELVDWTLVNSGTSFSVNVSGAQAGVWYYSTIRAVNHAGLETVFPSNGFLIMENTSGLNESSYSIPLIYPNPVADLLHIQYNEPWSAIRLYNSSGQLIQEVGSGQGATSIDLSGYAAGQYTIHMVSEKIEFKQQLIKQ